jgi:signal transduction histidine kinase/ActR/RegA family two-component response regulator
MPKMTADSSATGRPDAELGGLVATEQLRMVFAHMVFGTLVATAFALLLVAHLWDRVPQGELVVWVALKLAIAAPRVVQAQLHRRRGRPATSGWQRATTALLALDGACWGLGGAWLVGGETELVAVVAASLCCVASAATFGLQVRLAATAAYVVPMIAPTALALVARGDRFGVFAGLSLLLFLGLLLATARRSETRLAEVFRLRFLTDRISAERAEALELAQRQGMAKTQFLAAMSHELRTPLHGILGLARVIRTRHDDPELRHRLGLIEHSGEHLLQLINDLLDVSRLEAGRIEIHEEDFDLLAELDELVDVYLVRAHEKGLDFVVRVELAPPAWVRGDATRLRQVLHNLLGNALKFTERGRIGLTVRRTPDGDVEFEVRDTGPGIAAENLPHVFDAFWQTGSTSTRAAGAGLGLHIALEMARAMGGGIRSDSQLGLGSTFLFWLPLPEVQPRGIAANESGWIAGDFADAPRRVLLAEDNEVNALVVQAMLDRNCCEVVRVDNGDDAVQLATQVERRPDVVLMDCQMPVVDGLEATRRIRAREASLGLPRIPVIALTANTAMADRAECRHAGMDQFLGKPFTERELLAALAACQARPTPV